MSDLDVMLRLDSGLDGTGSTGLSAFVQRLGEKGWIKHKLG